MFASSRRRRAAVVLALAILGSTAQTRRPADRPSLDAADAAWRRGDYVAALNGYVQVLSSPGGDKSLARIALATGELYQTRELTADGRSPRFSPDGAFIVYETGLDVSRRTRILKNDATRAEVADLPGVSATFSHALNEVAYLSIPDAEEIRRAAAALAEAPLTARNRNQLIEALNWFIARHAAIVVRDLQSGREMELPAPDLLKSGLAFSADGRRLFFLGAYASDADRTDVYEISELAPKPVALVDTGGLKSAPIVDPAGKVLIYTVPAQNPLMPPPTGRVARGQVGQVGGVASFVIVDLASRRTSTVVGTAPTLSGDGRMLAYIARDQDGYALMVGPTSGGQRAVKQTARRLAAPALSDDGARVAFQEMVDDNWEIFVAESDGSNEIRVTRDIQHDVLPRFLGRDRLVAAIGEPRHRRSYLYDLPPSGARSEVQRTRLFHNNTVRTIAPEYQWSPSPDGTQLLIGAERDGNTVSPERGVYLVDLTRKVTKAAVLDRLRTNLRTETALKAFATRAFTSLAPEIRQIVATVSPTRIFGYEKTLFDFDSKHISKPGNRKAAEFLFDAYSSFGYAPTYQWLDPSTDRRVVSSTAGEEPPVREGFGGRTANVVATLRGTMNPDLVYVVGSHYDSVEAGPGADDDGSGTAALLETARVLAAHPLPATIVFASFTGEESGLLGSREFVRRALVDKLHVVAALNNDMVGWTNDERLDNTIRYSNSGIRDVQHAAAMLFTRLITYDARYFKGTDAASLYDAYGDVIGGIGSYPVLASPHYHQASDMLQYENHQLIAETAKTTVATLMLLASSPSRLTNLKVDAPASSTKVSWTPSPEKGVTSYIVAYGPETDPLRRRIVVTEPHATLPSIAPGSIVSVKAVNARGLEGWDWATIMVGSFAGSRMTP